MKAWSTNRCKATVSRFMKSSTKIITRYRTNFPATLKSSLFNIETNHQDTRPYHKPVCRELGGLMVSMAYHFSDKNPMRKGEWRVNVISLSCFNIAGLIWLLNNTKYQFHCSKISAGYDGSGLIFRGNVVRYFHGSGMPMINVNAF